MWVNLSKLSPKNKGLEKLGPNFALQELMTVASLTSTSELEKHGMRNKEPCGLHGRRPILALIEIHHLSASASSESANCWCQPQKAVLRVFDGKIATVIEHDHAHLSRPIQKEVAQENKGMIVG